MVKPQMLVRNPIPVLTSYSNIQADGEKLKRCTSLFNNEFLNSIYLAYMTHGELTLSPDDL